MARHSTVCEGGKANLRGLWVWGIGCGKDSTGGSPAYRVISNRGQITKGFKALSISVYLTYLEVTGRTLKSS